jgi:hypothetical protein
MTLTEMPTEERLKCVTCHLQNTILQTLDGYFVHFIAPDGIPKGDKDVIFVIDRSGSMLGAKLAQVKVQQL